MPAQNPIQKHTGRLQLSLGTGDNSVLSMHRETPLGETVLQLAHHRYVLATDDDGRITGIVSARQIFQRLESTNQYEKRRWQVMPLSSLLNVSFTLHDESPTVAARHTAECVAIAEGDHIFGLAIDDDIFLSWQRLEPLLSKALSDPLTGLLNRLAYERRLCEEWSRALRTGMSIGVVVIDLDSFKHINDSFGHTAGDAVLRDVGHELEASMRSYDVVARFGGDEFVALCLGCSAGDITIPVERIQRSVQDIDLAFEGSPLPVTVSIGAAVRHDGFESSDPRELFSAADECMYHAKASPESAWKVELGQGCPGIPEPVRFVCRDGAANELHAVQQ